MTKYEKLYAGISKTAWGYFFIYFDININQVSLLPAFIGYLLFLSAITLLEEEERELSLLRTLGIFLALWHGADWLMSWGAIKLDGLAPFLDIIVCLVNLYFHFQLLTNLASIATKHQPVDYELDAKLLGYRTWQTIMLTGIIIITYFSPWLEEVWGITSVVMAIIYVILGVCLMRVLFQLRRCLQISDDM